MWADCSAKELRKLTTLVIDHLPLLGHTNREIRTRKISLVYLFLVKKPEESQVDHLLSHSFQKVVNVTQGERKDVRMDVCRIFTQLLNFPGSLNPFRDQIIEVMIDLTSDDGNEVALLACEFWLKLAKMTLCQELLPADKEEVEAVEESEAKRSRLDLRTLPKLGMLLEILVKWMRLTASEISTMDTARNWNDSDKPENVRPRFNRRCEGDEEDESTVFWECALSNWNLNRFIQYPPDYKYTFFFSINARVKVSPVFMR